MPDRVVEIVHRIKQDKQALNALMRDAKRIDAAYEEQEDLIERVARAYTYLEENATKQAKASRDAADASIRAAKEQSELFGDVASRTSQLSGAFAGLGAVGGQRLMIASDLLDIAEAGQLLRAELPGLANQLVINAGGVKQLAVQLGVMSLVAGGILLLVREIGRVTAAARKEVEHFIAIQRELGQVQLEGLTGADIQDQINDLEALNKARQDEIAILEEERDRRVQELSRVGLLGEVTGIANQGIDDLNKRLEELNTAVLSSEAVIGLLNDSLRGEAAIAAEYKDEIQARFNAELDYSRLLQEGTVEGVEARIQAIQDELAINREFLDEVREADVAVGGFRDQINFFKGNISDLETELSTLNRVLPDLREAEGEEETFIGRLITGTKDLVAAREAEALGLLESIQTYSQSTIDQGARLFAQAEADRKAVIAETEAAIIEVQQATADKRADVIAQTEDQIADLQKDYAQQRLDNERDYYETITDLTAEFRKDEAKAQRDFQRDQARALRDHNDNLLDAAGKLDAVALLNEQRQFEKSQKDAKDNFKEEQKERADQFKERLKDEEEAFKKEQQQAERAYRDRERTLRDHLNRQLADLRSAQTQEIARLRGHQAQRLSAISAALDADLRELTGYQTDELDVRQSHYDAMRAQLQIFVDEANSIVGGLDAGGTTTTTTTVPDTPGAVGQFPLAGGGLGRPIGALASPFAASAGMLPPVSRSVNTVNNMPQVSANFVMPDHITPGMARNIARIAIDAIREELVA